MSILASLLLEDYKNLASFSNFLSWLMVSSNCSWSFSFYPSILFLSSFVFFIFLTVNVPFRRQSCYLRIFASFWLLVLGWLTSAGQFSSICCQLLSWRHWFPWGHPQCELQFYEFAFWGCRLLPSAQLYFYDWCLSFACISSHLHKFILFSLFFFLQHGKFTLFIMSIVTHSNIFMFFIS